MSTIQSFTIGSMTINASMPSALEQDEVLSLISSEVIQRATVAARTSLEMGEEILTPMFMSMPTSYKRRVSDTLLSKAFIAGTQTKVNVADFQGKMVQYNKLLAQLTLWNYEDFFTYLTDALKDAIAPPVTPQQE